MTVPQQTEPFSPTNLVIALGVVGTAIQAFVLLMIKNEITKATEKIRQWTEEFFARSESVAVQIKAIEKTAAGAAQAENVAIQITALENRIDDLPCHRCPAERP